jgi:hypothetical protein
MLATAVAGFRFFVLTDAFAVHDEFKTGFKMSPGLFDEYSRNMAFFREFMEGIPGLSAEIKDQYPKVP